MRKTYKPVVAGWLNILGGVVWLLGVVGLILVILGLSVGFGAPHGWALVRLRIFLAGLALPGLLGVTGGLTSLGRKHWVVAFIGALGVIPLGLGIASVILLWRSRNEFA